MHPINFKFSLEKSGRYAHWRVLNLIIVGLLLGGAMFTFYFIQQNIFSSIANANAIVALRANASADTVNLQAFAAAKDAIAEKKIKIELNTALRNIFFYAATSTRIASGTNQ
ncbi:hypothetical protein EPN28_00295 [Patescibacteria group bacterium]|nr:MAG: hypothetical protein EPN28_00295 [Patescibacteria group bacterium]